MAFSSVAKPLYNSHHWNKKTVKLSNFKTCFQIYAHSFTYSIFFHEYSQSESDECYSDYYKISSPESRPTTKAIIRIPGSECSKQHNSE